MIKVIPETKLSFEITDDDIFTFLDIFKIIKPEEKAGFKQNMFSKDQLKIINNMNKTRENLYGKDKL